MPKKKTDSFSPYDDVLAEAALSDPWVHAPGEPPIYQPDYSLLGRLLTVPIRAGALSESGSFAKGIDSWIAHELRRAAFSADEVWPRPLRPRVLPRDVAVLLENVPTKVREELAARIADTPAVAPVDARVLG